MAYRAYAQSKLANYHFAIGLQQRFAAADVAATSMLAHPGLTDSDLHSSAAAEGSAGVIGRAFDSYARHFGMNTEYGARPQLRAATDPDAYGGWFFTPGYSSNGPAVRRPYVRPGRDAALNILWRVSEHETGLSIDIAP